MNDHHSNLQFAAIRKLQLADDHACQGQDVTDVSVCV